MQNQFIETEVKGVIPTTNGCAIFLVCEPKTFVIYVDPGIATTLSMTINKVKKERPLTHDLIHNIFLGLEVVLQRVVINDVNGGTFFARIILTMENELGAKIVEIDARPSDAMVLALQAQKPIYTTRKVLDAVEDMSEVLDRLLNKGNDSST